MQLKPRAIVLCDFDGTAANQDVFDEILFAFGESPYGAIGTAFDDGKISHRKMNEGFVQSLKCSPSELESFLDKKVSLRRGFANFRAFLIENEIGFVVVSSGWDIYIRQILSGYKLYFANNVQSIADNLLGEGHVVLACNRVLYDGQSYSYTAHALEDERVSPNKAHIAAQLKAIYQVPVICIGDGISDYEMAAASDFVFATDRLAKHCAEKNISFLPFTSFEEISESLPGIIAKLTAPTTARLAKPLAANFK